MSSLVCCSVAEIYTAKILIFTSIFWKDLFTLLSLSSIAFETMKLLIAATILSAVGAYCPNACSGNGSCGINGKLSLFCRSNQLFRYRSSTRFFISHSLKSILLFAFSQTSVLVTTVPMAILLGQDMIAHYGPVPRVLHGHPNWPFPRTILIPKWNVPTREFVIVILANARALRTMMGRPVSVPCVPMIVLDVVFA